MSNILYPDGIATRLAPTYAATIELAVWNNLTLFEVTLTGTLTIDLDIDSETRDGAVLIGRIIQDATGRAVTFGTGFNAADDGIAGVANDTDVFEARYNSTTGVFDVVSVTKVVDAA